MQFYIADYILVVATVGAAILGLFGGFSGALGFCAGVVAAGFSAKFGYPLARGFIATQWVAAVAALAVALLAFGIARMIVKRVVKGLLAQPADAILGSLVAAATGVVVAVAGIVAARQLLYVQVDSAICSLLMGVAGC